MHPMRIIPLLALFSLANGFVSAETPVPRISEIKTTMVAALTGPQASTDQRVVDIRRSIAGCIPT
jgi:hypothetical protein